MDEELARAIRHESAAALRYWWGVCGVTVTKWRRSLSIGRKDTEGSRRLISRATMGGLNARQKRPLWTAEELGLLGNLPDEEVAARTGRTPHAVSSKRRELGVPCLVSTADLG